MVERMRAQGFDAFKLKVGFGLQTDRANLRELRTALGDDTPLMIDANQAWQPDEAIHRARELAEYRPLWLEEPIAADRPWTAWQQVAQECRIPLAAGENLRSERDFELALASRALRFVQPDVGKWGGVTGCLRVARAANGAGLSYCPHWLGGAIGLAASLHLKVATGGSGRVEIDANPNPLREAFLDTPVRCGRIELDERPGIGLDPSAVDFAPYVTWQGEHGGFSVQR
jgi:L-alanine-DL-glutamate epimerase-like enolase superfamily enzyme